MQREMTFYFSGGGWTGFLLTFKSRGNLSKKGRYLPIDNDVGRLAVIEGNANRSRKSKELKIAW